MMASDTIGAVVAMIEAAVSFSVYGGDHPEAGSQSPQAPGKAVVVKPSGGTPGDASLKTVTQRIDIFCYGATLPEADQVRREVYSLVKNMKRETHGDVLLHWMNPASGGTHLRDPDTGWPVMFQSFQVKASEEAIGG